MTVAKFVLMGLREYQRKRDFSTTSEPKGGKRKPKTVRGASRFVIQKHDARRLHYDFRLEMEGVLKSWAVPKGLPWKQGEKHLAVEVEDHPVDYAEFEGVIPEGQYGGGTVMLWDRGKYFVYGEQPLKSLRDGKLHLVLEGEKARGEWTLVRIRGRDGEKNQWLILKTGAGAKPVSKRLENQSVKTGRTMKQIAEARDAEWETNRDDKDANATSKFKARIRAALKKKEKEVGTPLRGVRLNKSGEGFDGQLGDLSLPAAKPRFIEPMKAKLVEKPPTTGDWIYELKFDGFRAIAVKIDNRVSLYSRNEKKLDARFPEIVDAIKQIPVRECVIDGEIVAVDEKGRSSFQLLQARELEGKKSPLYFYAFDLPQLEGRNLMSLPLEVRKNALEQLCATVAAGADRGSLTRFSGAIGGDAGPLLKEVKKRGLEGLIGKLRNSVYEPGRRSGAWIKLKCVTEQEFVIGGYTPPQGSRKHFGAILVGYYKDKKKEEDSRLVFAGKVGTGFTAKSLSILHKKFQNERRDDCPFVDLPSKSGGQWSQGITPSMMKKMHWVNPVFVCQIKFAEWTRDKKLRAPVFLGLREDKKPSDVIREV
jgi:bifunctional non-homologous end joining protein LigD